MKNSIKVTVHFSYQGTEYAPSIQLNLDEWMHKKNALPALDLLLAQQNNIDTYSYLYEVLQQGSFVYDQAQGLAADFCHEGTFNPEAFQQAWHQQQIEKQLARIAEQTLGIHSLQENQDIQQALMQAWQAGKASCK
ncbi:MAG: hypothetical protein KZQ58_08185 [gamma proteobacterium symbiont of Bathyaustriella thionipta]|nr:hypothetical protein [gamma proteobacterium symbiont of Bathyaustriella thionipta]